MIAFLGGGWIRCTESVLEASNPLREAANKPTSSLRGYNNARSFFFFVFFFFFFFLFSSHR